MKPFKMTLDVVRTQDTVQVECSSLSKLANDHHAALSRQVLQIGKRTAGHARALRMDHRVLILEPILVRIPPAHGSVKEVSQTQTFE